MKEAKNKGIAAESAPASMLLRAHEFAPPGLAHVKAGQTVLEMLSEAAQGDALSDDLEVRLCGSRLPSHLWAKVKPKTGAVIEVTRMGLAGGGGGLLRSIAMIAVAVAATWVTAGGAAAWGLGFAAKGTFAAAALGAGVTIAGPSLGAPLIAEAR